MYTASTSNRSQHINERTRQRRKPPRKTTAQKTTANIHAAAGWAGARGLVAARSACALNRRRWAQVRATARARRPKAGGWKTRARCHCGRKGAAAEQKNFSNFNESRTENRELHSAGWYLIINHGLMYYSLCRTAFRYVNITPVLLHGRPREGTTSHPKPTPYICNF